MVAAQQYLILGKTHTARCCVNKISELTRSLSAVTTQLIDLAGSGLDVQKGTVFYRLLYSCVNYPWMCGTNGIHAASPREAILNQ